jgi:ribose/xylose/arabinose/galactoside ABC-type transport system permease subunit
METLKKYFKSNTFTLTILLILIVAFFWAASPGRSYLSLINVTNILNSMVLFTLFAIGEALLIISGSVDLSPGYIGTASGALMTAVLANTGLPWFVALLLGLALGCVFGLINALLVNELGFQAFIATLTVGSFVAKGFAYILVDGKVIPIKNRVIVWIGTGRLFGIVPFTVILSLLMILIYGIILAKTVFGRTIYLCGGNSQAARLAGLNPRRLSYILFANSGVLGALAGILYDARLKSGNLDGTNNYAFPAVTAVILGGVSFGGGTGNMFGCFLGLLIINSFNNGLTVMGVTPYWQSVASGVLLLLALTLDYLANRRTKRIKVRRTVEA